MGDPVSAFIPNNSINCRAREFLTDTDQESLLEQMDLEQPQQAPSPGKGGDPGTKECGAAQSLHPRQGASGAASGLLRCSATVQQDRHYLCWLTFPPQHLLPPPPSLSAFFSLIKERSLHSRARRKNCKPKEFLFLQPLSPSTHQAPGVFVSLILQRRSA